MGVRKTGRRGVGGGGVGCERVGVQTETDRHRTDHSVNMTKQVMFNQ